MYNNSSRHKNLAFKEQIDSVLKSLFYHGDQFKNTMGRTFDFITDKSKITPPHIVFSSHDKSESFMVFAQQNIGIGLHYRHPDWPHSVKKQLPWSRIKPSGINVIDLIQEQLENMQDITNFESRSTIDTRPTEQRLREHLGKLKSLRM